jgi:hypothetical protein
MRYRVVQSRRTAIFPFGVRATFQKQPHHRRIPAIDGQIDQRIDDSLVRVLSVESVCEADLNR